jgi:uncharacterized RDD family membrane protein YckC
MEEKIGYASAVRRLVAYLIDAFVSLVMMLPLFIWYAMGLFGEKSGLYLLGYGVYLFFGMSCIRTLYLSIGWHIKSGTIGCKLTQISVTSLKGNPSTLFYSFIRYLGLILSTAFLGLGCVSILFTAHHQGIHDLMANTIVVHKIKIHY